MYVRVRAKVGVVSICALCVLVCGLSIVCVLGFGLVIALRPQTPKQIRGGWSPYTDTSKPVDGNGAQNMVTVQSEFEPVTFQSLAHELTNCSNRAHNVYLGICASE
jgi:hypothetical protein